jgi:hypothetical protein
MWAVRPERIYSKLDQAGVFLGTTKIAVHPHELLELMFLGLNGERDCVLRAADMRPESAKVDLRFYLAQ